MTVIRLMAVGLAATVALVILRSEKREMAVLLSLAVSVGMMTAAVLLVAPLYDYLTTLAGESGLSEILAVAVKALAVGILCSVAESVAKDAGETAVAERLSFAGRSAILLMTLPVLRSLVEAVKGFIT